MLLPVFVAPAFAVVLPVFAVPAPVRVAPAPVFVVPRLLVVAPRPVVVAPRPAFAAAPPVLAVRLVFAAPAAVAVPPETPVNVTKIAADAQSYLADGAEVSVVARPVEAGGLSAAAVTVGSSGQGAGGGRGLGGLAAVVMGSALTWLAARAAKAKAAMVEAVFMGMVLSI